MSLRRDSATAYGSKVLSSFIATVSGNRNDTNESFRPGFPAL